MIVRLNFSDETRKQDIHYIYFSSYSKLQRVLPWCAATFVFAKSEKIPSFMQSFAALENLLESLMKSHQNNVPYVNHIVELK